MAVVVAVLAPFLLFPPRPAGASPPVPAPVAAAAAAAVTAAAAAAAPSPLPRVPLFAVGLVSIRARFVRRHRARVFRRRGVHGHDADHPARARDLFRPAATHNSKFPRTAGEASQTPGRANARCSTCRLAGRAASKWSNESRGHDDHVHRAANSRHLHLRMSYSPGPPRHASFALRVSTTARAFSERETLESSGAFIGRRVRVQDVAVPNGRGFPMPSRRGRY